ncbi:hypothetical protein AHAS_Ahas07G0050300 [Arachis hypogaea]
MDKAEKKTRRREKEKVPTNPCLLQNCIATASSQLGSRYCECDYYDIVVRREFES